MNNTNLNDFDPIMNESIDNLMHYLSMTEEEFHKWTIDFNPDCKFFIDDDLISCVYTDGDEGVMLIKDVGEHHTISVVGQYCDINMKTLIKIAKKLVFMQDGLSTSGDIDPLFKVPK